MKLVSFIASALGISRRSAMDILKKGKVRVNGQPATDATLKVTAGRDRVDFKGKVLRPLPDLYFVMYKPRKTICSKSDPQGRRTVIDLLSPEHRRADTVGRLDYNTTGVLLLTTDGLLAQRLLRSRKLPRKYLVKLKGKVSEENFNRWRRGIVIEGKRTPSATVHVLSRKGDLAKVLLIITEGRYRVIHRMALKTGMHVVKIHRVAFGSVTLGGLRPGMYRPLTPAEIVRLQRFC